MFVVKIIIFIFCFRVYNNWVWVLVIVCLLGGVLGVIVYIIIIEFYYLVFVDIEYFYELICIVVVRIE